MNIDAVLANIAIEDGTHYILTKEELRECFLGEYSQAFKLMKDDVCFFRGMDLAEDMFIASPSKRKSRNGNNVYTLLISHLLPSWKRYPKRDKCFILTDNQRDANNYGHVYIAFPKNDAIVCISDSSDIWQAFNSDAANALRITSLNQLNDNIIYLIAIVNNYAAGKGIKYTLDNKEIEEPFEKDYAAAVQLMKDVEKKIKKLKPIEIEYISKNAFKDNLLTARRIFDKLAGGESFIKILDKALNPTDNGFKLKKLDNVKKNTSIVGNEMWTESECLFVELNLMENLISENDESIYDLL